MLEVTSGYSTLKNNLFLWERCLLADLKGEATDNRLRTDDFAHIRAGVALREYCCDESLTVTLGSDDGHSASFSSSPSDPLRENLKN